MSRGKIVSLHDCRNGETEYYRSYSFAILTTKIREIQRRGGVIRSQKTKDRTRTIGRRFAEKDAQLSKSLHKPWDKFYCSR